MWMYIWFSIILYERRVCKFVTIAYCSKNMTMCPGSLPMLLSEIYDEFLCLPSIMSKLLRIFFLIWTYLISNTKTSAPLSDFLFLTVLCIVPSPRHCLYFGKVFNFYVLCFLIWQMGIIIVRTSENSFED